MNFKSFHELSVTFFLVGSYCTYLKVVVERSMTPDTLHLHAVGNPVTQHNRVESYRYIANRFKTEEVIRICSVLHSTPYSPDSRTPQREFFFFFFFTVTDRNKQSTIPRT